ncbi:MAG: hypothetical protein EOO75_16150 [Myxococcales bacterium]|nr:MAG: hypothetical protein EOO75_16150 [Myxococcales bacterium]
MRTVSSIVALVVMAAAPLLTVAACSKDDGRSTSPGPAENAGRKVDETAHDAKEGAKEGAQTVKEGAQGAATAAGSAVERAGEKMQGK